MSAFADPKFEASSYSKFRPTYPPEFYELLLNYHSKINDNKLKKLLDVGCGPGEASIPLIPYITDTIVSTDISQVMLDKAKHNFELAVPAGDSSSGSTTKPKFEFIVSSGEQLTENINCGDKKSDLFDLLISAQAVHWIDPKSFLSQASQLLNKGGTLSYFGYVDPIFTGYPEADAIYNELAYESGSYLGPYWEQPGRNKIRNLFKDLNDMISTDTKNWADVDIEYYNSAIMKLTDEEKKRKLIIERSLSVRDYLNYVKTFSSNHHWATKNPDRKNEIVNVFYNKLNKQMGWNWDTLIKISWKTVYVFARRR